MVRDYYHILGILPQASNTEIKLAYRNLAKQFHPDIVGNDEAKLQWFAVIKEAYETLISSEKRYQYHEKRWLLKSEGKSFGNSVLVDAGSIVKEIIALEKSIHFGNNMHRQELIIATRISECLPGKNIAILNNTRDFTLNATVVEYLLRMVDNVPLNYLKKLKEKADAILLQNRVEVDQKLQKKIRERKQWIWLEKNKWVAVVLLTAFLLLFIRKILG